MSKEIHIVCSNVYKNNNKDAFKLEFNKKLIQVINESERNKSYIGKVD